MSTQRSPPPKTTLHLKCPSNPDLPESYRSHNEETFSQIRKRKQPDDLKIVLEHVEEKINMQLNSWKTQLDTVIANSVKNSIDTIINQEVKKISLSISNSFKELGDRLDTIDKSLSYAMERQDDIDKRLKDVEIQCRSSGNAGNQIMLLEEKIDAMEQQARMYNIEIANLPERRDENLLSIVEKVGTVIKHPIKPSDIVSVHRVPHFDKKTSRPKNIIVKFTTKILRDNFITASRVSKSLKSDQLSIQGTVQNVYINEHLTAKNKLLFRLCREQAKKCNYKFVWIKHGTVLVRQTESSPIFSVRREHDIKKIK